MAHDLRFALRMICSHRLFSAAVVATLALGIGLNTMVFTLINAVLFKPVPVPGGAQLVALASRDLKLRYVLPRVIDLAMRNEETARLRAAWIPLARGEVLEI